MIQLIEHDERKRVYYTNAFDTALYFSSMYKGEIKLAANGWNVII